MGNGQFDKTSIIAANNVSGISFFLQDVNGDGRSDLLKVQGNQLLTYISDNNTLTYLSDNVTSMTQNSVIVPFDQNGWNFNNQLIMFKDRSLTRYVYNRNDSKEHLLTGMVTSMGVVNKNNYKALYYDGSPFYTNGCCAKYPYDNFQGPIFATESTEQYLNGTLVENPHYQYTNAVVHKQGRGFCGFEKILSQDYIRGNRISVQTYDPYNFSVLKSQDSYLGLDTMSYSISVAANKIAKIQMTNRYSLDKAKNISLNHSYSNFDAYGNPLNETINYGSGITETTVSSYSNNTNESAYLLGFLYDQTKTTNRNGTAWTERFYIPANDSKGQPNVIVHYKNGNQVNQKSFSYNSQGLAIQKNDFSYSSSANTLITKYLYDSYGRLTTETDPLGLATTYAYDASNGSLISTTDHKGQATKYTYDVFSRKTGYTYPEGTSGVTQYSWNAAGTNGLYCLYQCESGSPWTKTYYDALDRETASSGLNYDYGEPCIEKQYDSYGRLSKVSLPYVIQYASASYWNTYQYDSFDRPTSFTEASGHATSYSYSGNSVTTTKDGIASTQTFDPQGNLISVTDPGGTITFNLRPDGQPSSIVAPGSVTTSFGYDNYGRRTSITDPSAGSKSNTYDTAGNIASETDANGKTISYGYDSYNRLISKTCPEFTLTNVYNADGLLETETSSNGTSIAYIYDTYGRLQKEKETVPDGKWLEKTYNYASSYLESTQYVSQSGTIVTENYIHDAGHLKEIKLNGTTSIWKINGINAFGQPTNVTTGSFNRTYGYDAYGLPTGRTAGSFQNLTYKFDATKGNLSYRTDNTRSKQESFTYDNLNRLTGYSGQTASYDVNGNINSKTDVGTFQYDIIGKPYALSGVASPTNLIPQRNQTITYTSFERPASITEEDYTAAFTYNGNDGRVKMEVKKSGAKELTRYYISDCYEIDDRAVGGVKEKLYLGGDFYSASAVYVKEGTGSWNIYYICRDYQGSITHITNSSGSVVQELSYDAWGQLRNPADQTVFAPDAAPELFLGRGYTGHEHLLWFSLVNMNGRLYDAALGRFLSPDPFVQAPNLSQSFNRYSYALNNPLRYIDLSGYTWFTQFGKWLGSDGRFIVSTVVTIGVAVGVTAICVATGGLGAVAIAAIAGASSGLVGSVLNTAFSGGGLKDYAVNAAMGTAIGAAAGMVGYGVGNWASGAIKNGLFSLAGGSGVAISSPVLNGAITGVAGGALGGGAAGYAGGFLGALIQTGDLAKANQAGIKGLESGLLMGSAIGGALGAYGGYKYAKDNGYDPWTGKQNVAINSSDKVQSLIDKSYNLSTLSDGTTTQGFVQGDPQNIYQDLIQGAQNIRDNLYQLPDGTYINYHPSTSTGIPTIDINRGGSIYKIRIVR